MSFAPAVSATPLDRQGSCRRELANERGRAPEQVAPEFDAEQWLKGRGMLGLGRKRRGVVDAARGLDALRESVKT